MSRGPGITCRPSITLEGWCWYSNYVEYRSRSRMTIICLIGEGLELWTSRPRPPPETQFPTGGTSTIISLTSSVIPNVWSLSFFWNLGSQDRRGGYLYDNIPYIFHHSKRIELSFLWNQGSQDQKGGKYELGICFLYHVSCPDKVVEHCFKTVC